MTQAQLPLKPTISWEAGESSVWQCSWCGALVYNTRGPDKPEGPCSVCLWGCPEGAAGWWSQDLPVGPFEGGG